MALDRYQYGNNAIIALACRWVRQFEKFAFFCNFSRESLILGISNFGSACGEVGNTANSGQRSSPKWGSKKNLFMVRDSPL
jgi:hypothetical protein